LTLTITRKFLLLGACLIAAPTLLAVIALEGLSRIDATMGGAMAAQMRENVATDMRWRALRLHVATLNLANGDHGKAGGTSDDIKAIKSDLHQLAEKADRLADLLRSNAEESQATEIVGHVQAFSAQIKNIVAKMRGNEWSNKSVSAARQSLAMNSEALAKALASLKNSLNDRAFDKMHSNHAAISISRDLTRIATLAAMLTLVAMLFWLYRGTVRPIRQISGALLQLSGGDRNIDLPHEKRGDELGEMSRAAGVFRQTMIKSLHLAEARDQEQSERLKRADAIEARSAEFEEESIAALSIMAKAIESLRANARDMQSLASETGQQSITVASASKQASDSVAAVAQTADELSRTITEVAKQVSNSGAIAADAMSRASRAEESVQGLNELAQQVGKIISLISDIADNTNLLALNATIEAARAGEAGKGFAVVASEVKALSNQTTQATDTIAHQITEIQRAADHTAQAIKEMSAAVARIGEVSQSIVAAVNEQSSAAESIAHCAEEAARGTDEIARNIDTVSEATVNTGRQANTVRSAADQLEAQSLKQQQSIEQFLRDVKAA